MYENGLIRKLRLISKFITSQMEGYFSVLLFSIPANIRLNEDVLKTSCQDVFKTFSRWRLQDVLQKRLQDIFKNVFKTSSRLLQDVFKTSSRPLQDVLPRRLQDVLQKRLQDIFKTSSKRFEGVFKTSSRHLQVVFKTFWRHLQDVLERYLQDVFKTYHQGKLFLLSILRDVFITFLRRTAKTVIYKRICLGHTSGKFTVSVQNLQEW